MRIAAPAAPDERAVSESAFAHPEGNHPIQCAPLDAQSAAQFIELQRLFCLFECV
jgi:hypothetical protein